MLERRQKKRPETAPLRIGCGNIVLLKQSGKKLLRQVLRFMDAVDPSPHLSIQRIPIRLAEPSERFLRVVALMIPGR